MFFSASLQACWDDPRDLDGPVCQRREAGFAPMPHDPLSLLSVLCLDGGGLKGVCAARLLVHLESKLETDRICDVFQGGITGTSAGSFIALALAVPHHKNAQGE